jgi:hypothetical protein
MGLDTSHDCWHGAYGAFGRWRDKLAEVAGYEIAKVDFSGRSGGVADLLGPHDMVLIDWGHVTEAQLNGDWDETPADPLLVLIAHSDCDGWIRAAQAGPLADRLQELLPLLPDEEAPGHVRHWHTTTQRFIDGLRAAAAAGEDVEFA